MTRHVKNALILLLFVSTFTSVAPATPPTAQIVPISGPLGLADLRIEADQGTAPTAEILLPSGQTLHAPMIRDAGFWSARIMTGSPALTGRVTRDGKILATIDGSPDPGARLATPDWAKGAVWYQLFVERYRNANPDNDPARAGVYPIAWTADFDAVSAEEFAHNAAAAVAGHYSLDLNQPGGMKYNVIWHRRYGGDLQGVVEKLDELADLGVTALYFCPVFESGSLHKYDATDFRHIDQSFGDPAAPPQEYTPDPVETMDPATWKWSPADRYFLDVVLPEAHKRGMRVIIDGVWNHVGLDFWAFKDIREHGSASPYADWFDVRFNDRGQLIGWRAWDRENGHLPRFRRDADANLVEPVKKHVFDVTRRWMDPNANGDPSDGVDGWRLDVAPEIDVVFWREWRALVKSINPDAVTIGEIWFDAGPKYFGGEAFDGQMNYPFAFEAVRWLGSPAEVGANELHRTMKIVFAHAPQNDLVQFNLLDSHDTERVASMMANPGRGYDQGARLHDNPAPGYDPVADDHALRRVVLGAALMATWPGAPMIYYGDEYGMNGADDPDNRRPVPWPDAGTPENPDERFDPALRSEVRSWLRLRSGPLADVLRFGSVHAADSGRPDVLAFERRLNDQVVLVVINGGSAPYDATPLLGAAGLSRDGGWVGPLSATAWSSAEPGQFPNDAQE